MDQGSQERKHKKYETDESNFKRIILFFNEWNVSDELNGKFIYNLLLPLQVNIFTEKWGHMVREEGT